MSPQRIAVIGCGAITEALYLPALRRLTPSLELVFVDADHQRAQRAAQSIPASRWSGDYREVTNDVDGAIVAVPPSVHHMVALHFLEHGIDVLCEKPLALSLADAEELVRVADRRGTTLAVNNGRRLFPAFREVARLAATGALGTLDSLELELGEAFDWPAASASYFGVAAGGRGVLLDIGAHIVDLACWWLGGRPTLVSYADDSLGGTEAYAKLTFASGACTGHITLSWLSRLANRYRLCGDAGVVSGNMYDWRSLDLTTEGRTRRLQLATRAKTISEAAYGIVDNFVDVLAGRAAPLITGRDVLPSIGLIEECYARRQRVPMSWHDAMELILDAR